MSDSSYILFAFFVNEKGILLTQLEMFIVSAKLKRAITFMGFSGTGFYEHFLITSPSHNSSVICLGIEEIYFNCTHGRIQDFIVWELWKK